MNKKLLLLGLIPVAALVIYMIATKTPEVSAPTVGTQQQQKAQQSQAISELPPLPEDDSKAIDGEVDAIDQDLKSTNSTTDQNDLSDAELGL